MSLHNRPVADTPAATPPGIGANTLLDHSTAEHYTGAKGGREPWRKGPSAELLRRKGSTNGNLMASESRAALLKYV